MCTETLKNVATMFYGVNRFVKLSHVLDMLLVFHQIKKLFIHIPIYCATFE